MKSGGTIDLSGLMDLQHSWDMGPQTEANKSRGRYVKTEAQSCPSTTHTNIHENTHKRALTHGHTHTHTHTHTPDQ